MRYTNNLYISAEDHLTLLQSCSFSGSVSSLFCALLNGATCFPFSLQQDGPDQLASWVSRERISIYHSVPSIFRLIATGIYEYPSLRIIRLEGDQTSPRDLKLYKMFFPDTSILVNGLGATECGIVRQYFVNKKTPIPDSVVPIGYAVEDMEILLLDESKKQVGMNCVGEIAVRSFYLSPGYWRRSELTEAAFEADPNGGGERTYQTGDIGRMLPDGCLLYLGRKDFQVKIRGYRVEIAEVETALLDLENIQEAVVVDGEDSLGEKRLIAYLVCDTNLTVSVSSLRSALLQTLPDYMVPTTFVILDALPLNPYGKVDRKALPEPDNLRPELENAYVPAHTPIEQTLTEIWSDVLNINSVGIDDKFLELGGNSLMAMQVITRVLKTFQVKLLPKSLFEAPTVADMAVVIAQEQVERPMKKETLIATEPPIFRRGTLDPCSVSFAQQRLWFLDQYECGSAVYNIPNAVRLNGLLDVAVLEQSLNEIVQRHEALRTTFSAVRGKPMQVITPTLPLTLALTDLQKLPKFKRQAEVRRLANQEAQCPFDLSQGPLLRASLLRLGKKDHVLLLTMHHVVSDGWSMGVLFRELSVLYEAFSAGRPSPLSELPIQYADFAVWQRQWLQGEVLEEQLDYWKKQLNEAPPLLELSTDCPRPAVQTFRGASRSMVLTETLSEALRTLSRQEDVTLYMTILAAFQTLLYRYTDQDDIVVGSPIAGRNRSEIEGLIGFFVNTLVLRTDLSENPTFRQLLGRVRKVCLGAYAHQDLPFEKLVEELQPERNLTHSPLFQAMFAFQNIPRHELELKGLRVNPLVADNETAKFDLTLFMEEKAQGLKGKLEYNTDLFNSPTIERMVGHFQTLLKGIVANPEQRISEIPLLMAAERHQLLVEWNDTKTDYPRDKCIHHLFEEQVERSPEAVALVFEDQQMTYGELNCRANQLAHHLQSTGVEPEVLVGVCMEHSIEMIVGLLGILKAGGAYLPLDPAYPKERLQYMVKDSGVDLILTSMGLIDLVKSLGDVSPIPLDSDDYFFKSIVDNDIVPANVVCTGNLGYVLYTSGSTGLPKGTLVEHKSLVNYLYWINTGLLVDHELQIPLITKLTFDASLKQLFAPLIRGDVVWLLPDHVMAQPARLLQALATDSKVGLNCIPSLWEAILDVLRNDPNILPPDNLSHLFIGGERLSKDLVNRTFATLPHLEIWNLYGPSETTANSSATRVDSKGDVTIGRPIANTKIYILDPYLQPTPIGVPGELHIGGDGLSRGYLNRPKMTAERFIPNPFSGKLGARLYKTGDLVRYLPDGYIEFQGRIDHQVKIRGFRIELGEIESVLRQHSAVRKTVVIDREDQPGDKRLVAYVVPRQNAALVVGELRNLLQRKLPSYMVPSAFVILDALPLMPNGKIDRKALPEPDSERPDIENPYVGPRTPTEELLAGIWCEVIGLKKVGINDNFFELGGHSLLATQVISRVINTFRVKVPLRSLFQAPTVAELAVVIAQEQVEKAEGKDIDSMLAELEALSDEEA
jgi:amino acid adenylation domain-containing protein